MPYQFTVSPDFSPEHISGWYIFNTWLQKNLGETIHLEMYNDFHSQRAAIQEDKIDLIYANPYDAAMLVREKGFQPLVKPENAADEAVIAVHAENAATDIEHLQQGLRVAVTEDPDVHMLGMIMLEPADLHGDNIQLQTYDSYVLVAKHLLQGDSDAGIFLAEAYDDLSNMIKKQLKILVRSQISVIHHSLLIGSKLLDRRTELQKILTAMSASGKGKGVLASLGFTGWTSVDDEEMEFMIDLMDTLMV